MQDFIEAKASPSARSVRNKKALRYGLIASGMGALLLVGGIGKAAVGCGGANDFCETGVEARSCTQARQIKRTLSCIWRSAKNDLKQPVAWVTGKGTGAKQDVTVSSVAELNTALDRAKSGSVIRLMAGTYPAVLIRSVNIDGNVTITSADPEHHAVLQGMTVRDSSGLTFRALDFSATAPGAQYGFLVTGSHDVQLDQLVFDSPAVPIDKRIISALQLRGVQNVVVSRSQFRNYWNGITMLDVTGVKIVANELRDMRTDGIRGGGISDLLITQNVCADFRPVKPDHPDCIQLWSTNQTEPGRNIRIIDNLAWRRNGIQTQGIFIRDTFDKLPFENIEITGNLMIGTLYNAIAVSGLHGGTIANNEVIAYPDQKAWILINNGFGVTMNNNRAMIFLLRGQNDVKQSDNKLTNPTDKHIPQRIAQWLATKPDMQKNAGPLLRELIADQEK